MPTSKFVIGFTPRNFLSFLLFLLLGFCLSVVLNSCQLADSPNSSLKATETQPLKAVRIGIQSAGGHLYVLKESGTLERRLAPMGVAVKWVEFSAGRFITAAMGKDEIDLGFVGAVPSVTSQAQDVPLVYVANEPAAPQFTGFLVRQDAPIRTITDLKGKKVATTKASSAHYLLFQGLRDNRLTLDDIQFVDLPPEKGQAAFKQGEVDAWVGWHPYLAQLQASIPTRLLASGEGLVSNRNYYLATRDFASKHADIIPIVMSEMRAAGLWVNQHQKAAATIIAKSMKLDQPVALKMIASRTNGDTQIQDRALEEQQRIADTFFRLELLPKQIRVEDAVWKGRLTY